MQSKKKVLNLYAGLGGNRKEWGNCDVTAVEYNAEIAELYKTFYPNDKVVIADAHEYLKNHYKEYDFIWSSPPCQKHSVMMKATRHDVADYFDLKLYQEIIFLDNFFKGDWIVENVVPYYKPLIEPKIKVGRHIFWSNKYLFGIENIKQPKGFISKATKQELMDWLGIYFKKNIYLNGNHCPVQILRNCVHPKIGAQLYNSIIEK